MDRDFYFFAGAQYEFLYHYKEKEFRPDPEGKRKYTEWFSDRLNMLLPSMFLGVTFPEGHSMKITIALNDMMNKDYSFVSSQGANIRPYEYMSSQLIYISYFKMVRWEKSTYKKVIEEKRQFAER
jgi:hypothetical protein